MRADFCSIIKAEPADECHHFVSKMPKKTQKRRSAASASAAEKAADTAREAQQKRAAEDERAREEEERRSDEESGGDAQSLAVKTHVHRTCTHLQHASEQVHLT